MKKVLAFLLTLTMLCGMVPMTAFPVLAEEHAHTYEDGICTGCGTEDPDGLKLDGLNVLCLGDSITAGQGLTTDTRWTNVLASKYGWNLTNKSQGGISLSSYYYTANGTADVSIAKKAEVLKTMTTKPDVIIVWGGHNDTSYRYSPLGTWDDETTDSFKGALKYIAKLADEYAPDATLFVLAPLWNNENPSTLKVPEGTTDTNWMFVDAIYEGAETYGWIPINMDLCGITPFTKSGLLLDNIHPNESGTEKIVEYLSEELASYGANSRKQTILFNHSSVSIENGKTTTLKAVLSPRSGNGSPVFTWSSSNSSVATVDANGKITAVAHGNATITATTDNDVSATVQVSVAEGEHTYESTVTAPTCTEQGYTTYSCECGDSYVSDYVAAAGYHALGDWETVREAAYQKDGEEMRRCDKCSHIETRTTTVTVVTSGNLGKGTTPTDTVIYTLYSDGTMVLEGEGALFGIDWRGDNQPFIEYRQQVKHLIIGEGITSTTSGSLVKLSNLETIQFPSTLTHLPQNALMSCFRADITQLTIPATVVHLGAYSIGHYTGDPSAYFTDVIIENPNVQFTDHVAVFNGGSKLDTLTLYSYGPENNVSAYAAKYGIRYVDLNNYHAGTFGDVDYMLYDGVLTLSTDKQDAIIAAANQPWQAYRDSITQIEIGQGITAIAAEAFKDCTALETVIIPDNLKSIGDSAFAVSKDTTVVLSLTIPKHIQSLGNHLFGGRHQVDVCGYYDSLAEQLTDANVNLTLKKVYKLLFIGNSYSEDASNGSHTTDSQMFTILQAMLGEDADVTVALLSSGGKGMHWHATQAEQNNAAYGFKVISTSNPKWKSLGTSTSANALAWTDWDAVSLQPYNINVKTGQESVPYPDTTDPKFYNIETACAFMLDHTTRYAPYADIYFYMHWAQTSTTTLNAALKNYNNMADFMPQVLNYAGTETGAQFKTIVPVGLSIQNARTTYLALLRYNTTAYADGNLNLNTDAQIGLQRDGGHVSFNIGRYIAALTFAEMLIPEEMRAPGYVLPDIRVTQSVGQLPKEYSIIAQKSVHAAVESWKNGSLAVTDIVGYTQDPTVDAGKTLEGMSFALDCDTAEGLVAQLSAAVLAVLPADFAVDAVAFDEARQTATVTIRFGYTSLVVNVSCSVADHAYAPTVTAPSCAEAGYVVYTCRCGHSFTETLGEPTGDHIYDHKYDADCNTCGAIREVPPILYGDADSDGAVNNRDLGLLQRYLNAWSVTVDTLAADLDADGKLTNRDLALLQRLINEWETTST